MLPRTGITRGGDAEAVQTTDDDCDDNNTVNSQFPKLLLKPA